MSEFFAKNSEVPGNSRREFLKWRIPGNSRTGIPGGLAYDDEIIIIIMYFNVGASLIVLHNAFIKYSTFDVYISSYLKLFICYSAVDMVDLEVHEHQWQPIVVQNVFT